MTTTKQFLTHTYRVQDTSFDVVPDHIFNAIQTILNKRGKSFNKDLKHEETKKED